MVIAGMVITGPGIGACLIGSIMSAQNALSAKDIGAGTGALLVLRSVGGASGSTLAGAIIASALAGLQQAATGAASLAAHPVQRGSAAMTKIAGDGLTAAAGHLGRGFGMVYVTAAAFAAISFAVTLRMPNTPLRESLHPIPVAE